MYSGHRLFLRRWRVEGIHRSLLNHPGSAAQFAWPCGSVLYSFSARGLIIVVYKHRASQNTNAFAKLLDSREGRRKLETRPAIAPCEKVITDRKSKSWEKIGRKKKKHTFCVLILSSRFTKIPESCLFSQSLIQWDFSVRGRRISKDCESRLCFVSLF